MKMLIKNIEYLDKSEGEGFITICSEKIIIEKCFIYASHPLKIRNNDIVNIKRLDNLNCDSKNNNLYISREKIEYIKYDEISGIYIICCMLIDKDNNIGIIGDIEISIDGYLPGDSKNGDYIIFNATRIDLDEENIVKIGVNV